MFWQSTSTISSAYYWQSRVAGELCRNGPIHLRKGTQRASTEEYEDCTQYKTRKIRPGGQDDGLGWIVPNISPLHPKFILYICNLFLDPCPIFQKSTSIDFSDSVDAAGVLVQRSSSVVTQNVHPLFEDNLARRGRWVACSPCCPGLLNWPHADESKSKLGSRSRSIRTACSQ
jgi:hypothetical protein